MKVVIGSASESITDKVTLVARRIRIDITNKKTNVSKAGPISNELAATIIGARSKRARDIIRMKTQDCMVENLPTFVRMSARELKRRMSLLTGLDKASHDWCVTADTFEQFADQLQRSKHYT